MQSLGLVDCEELLEYRAHLDASQRLHGVRVRKTSEVVDKHAHILVAVIVFRNGLKIRCVTAEHVAKVGGDCFWTWKLSSNGSK